MDGFQSAWVFAIFLISSVEAAKNIALLKPTQQSTTAHDGPSKLAVDGDTNMDYGHKSCTHSADGVNYQEWWCVDLQKIANITSIKLYNRLYYMPRLKGFDVLLSNNGLCNGNGMVNARTCFKDKQTTPQKHYVIDRCDQETGTSLYGRFLYVHIKGPARTLTLCEVEVYEACPNGFYGDNCYSRCAPNCKNGICDDDTGKCGECKDGYYGDRCDETCDTCKESCRQLDGSCQSGCKEGYWGPNGLCLETCPYCAPGGCQFENGVCYNGCPAGTQHKKCS